ncbi:hypothetical protein [Natronorarus salvus]|uniref:hypothetical protein n=1 Tax=Natronorarus salvus TaxID=3117733 RepID=UPI002F26B088
MNLTRRNVLLGLGTMTIGGGAAFGSGAFSQVEADRSVTVDVAEDSAALIALAPGESAYVYEDENGLIVIDLGGDAFDDADGLNLGAVTTLTEALSVTNNHDETVEITIDGVDNDGIDVGFEESEYGEGIAGYELASGSTLDLDIVIDTRGANADSRIDEDVTILAESTE